MQQIRFFVVFACLAALGLASGCGYQLASREPSVLTRASGVEVEPNSTIGLPTMKIKGVDNPTLYISLEHQLRAALRDAIANRKIAQWKDSGVADYEVQINIIRYKMDGWGYSREGISVMYSASITMELIVYGGDTNTEVWRSGRIGLSRTYDTDSEMDAAYALALEVTERLVDRMRSVF